MRWIEAVTIIGVLLLVETGVLLAAGRRPRLFRILPPLFWIYFLPTVASAVGLIPHHSPVYPALVDNLLPASLALLFISVDLPGVTRVGRLALGTMGLSTAGIFVGGPLVLLLFGRWLPPDAWAGIGALSASWMGGSANMVAVKASIGTPEAVFAQAVVVDVVVAYSWMALLMALATQQHRFDRWIHAREGGWHLPREGGWHLPEGGWHLPEGGWHLHLLYVVAIVAVGVGCAAVARIIGWMLPEVPGAISSFTWTVLAVSALGIALSFSPLRDLERHGASRLGYWSLYLVLSCIGAQAELVALARAPLVVVAGVAWITIHGAVLVIGGWLIRAPLFLLATASQANIGGPVSAPIVAAAYRPDAASIGLLLAVIGNVSGTYLGILCSLICKRVAGQ